MEYEDFQKEMQELREKKMIIEKAIKVQKKKYQAVFEDDKDRFENIMDRKEMVQEKFDETQEKADDKKNEIFKLIENHKKNPLIDKTWIN